MGLDLDLGRVGTESTAGAGGVTEHHVVNRNKLWQVLTGAMDSAQSNGDRVEARGDRKEKFIRVIVVVVAISLFHHSANRGVTLDTTKDGVASL